MRRFLLDHPCTAEFIDMGLGKTSVALTVVSDLLAGLEISGALVVGPIRVIDQAGPWHEERATWDHVRHLRLVTLRGSPAQRLKLLSEPADVYLINYELIAWLADVTRTMKTLPFDMVIFDESSKMKSHKAVRFRRIKPMLPRFPRRVIMTGTPRPNNYLDLWSQVFLLDGGKRLGAFFTHFRDRYFDFNPYSYECKIKPGAARAIRNAIRDITIAMRSEDYLKLPPIIYTDVKVPLEPSVMAKYRTLQKTMFLELEKAEIEAFNAAALTNKCRQFTSGVMYDEDLKEHVVHDAKMDALEDIIDDAGGNPVLVVYEFRSELARLRKRWPKAPWIGGGSKDPDGAIRAWNTGKTQVMLVHPASVGHGLNLQHGGRRMVWTSMTWSLELYQQMVKRLHRQGQKKPVLVSHLVAPGTVDEAVLEALRGKAKGQDALMRALRRLKARL